MASSPVHSCSAAPEEPPASSPPSSTPHPQPPANNPSPSAAHASSIRSISGTSHKLAPLRRSAATPSHHRQISYIFDAARRALWLQQQQQQQQQHQQHHHHQAPHHHHQLQYQHRPRPPARPPPPTTAQHHQPALRSRIPRLGRPPEAASSSAANSSQLRDLALGHRVCRGQRPPQLDARGLSATNSVAALCPPRRTSLPVADGHAIVSPRPPPGSLANRPTVSAHPFRHVHEVPVSSSPLESVVSQKGDRDRRPGPSAADMSRIQQWLADVPLPDDVVSDRHPGAATHDGCPDLQEPISPPTLATSSARGHRIVPASAAAKALNNAQERSCSALSRFHLSDDSDKENVSPLLHSAPPAHSSHQHYPRSHSAPSSSSAGFVVSLANDDVFSPVHQSDSPCRHPLTDPNVRPMPLLAGLGPPLPNGHELLPPRRKKVRHLGTRAGSRFDAEQPFFEVAEDDEDNESVGTGGNAGGHGVGLREQQARAPSAVHDNCDHSPDAGAAVTARESPVGADTVTDSRVIGDDRNVVELSPLVTPFRKGHRPRRARCASYYDEDIYTPTLARTRPYTRTTTKSEQGYKEQRCEGNADPGQK